MVCFFEVFLLFEEYFLMEICFIGKLIIIFALEIFSNGNMIKQ